MTSPFVSTAMQDNGLGGNTAGNDPNMVTYTGSNQVGQAILDASLGKPASNKPATLSTQYASPVANPFGRALAAYEPNTQVYIDQANQAGTTIKAMAGTSAEQKLASPSGGADLTPLDDPAADQLAATEAAGKAANQTTYATGGVVDAHGKVQAMVAAALALAARHVPYVWGGTTASGVDCSGLIFYAANAAGIQWNRYRAQDYGHMGTAVDLASARPGDIVFYDEGGGAGHVGIYVGNGRMVAAPQTGENVQVQAVYGTPTSIRRVFNDNQFGTAATPYGGQDYTYGGRQYTPFTQVDAVTGQLQNILGGLFGHTSVFNDNMSQVRTANEHVGQAEPGVAYTGPAVVGTGVLRGPVPYANLFTAAANKWGVPAGLLAAVAEQESGFNPNARSSAGAIGMMQFMPGTARGLGVNPLDPASAVDGAARYLSGLANMFGGDWTKAVAAYNAGAGAVRQYGGVPPYAETQRYVQNVLARSHFYSG